MQQGGRLAGKGWGGRKTENVAVSTRATPAGCAIEIVITALHQPGIRGEVAAEAAGAASQGRKGGQHAVGGDLENRAGVVRAAAPGGAIEIAIRPQYQRGHWISAVAVIGKR